MFYNAGLFGRRPMRLVVSAVAFAVAIGSVAPPAARSEGSARAVVVTPVLSATATAAGQPIILPRGAARVIVSTYVIAAGARLPVHRHRYPRYAYVLQGRLRVTDTQTHRTFDYAQGAFAIEVVNDLHFGENPGSTPLRLLVIDFVPKAVTANTLP